MDGIRRGAPLETHGARERRARADRASRRGRGRIAKRRLRPRRAFASDAPRLSLLRASGPRDLLRDLAFDPSSFARTVESVFDVASLVAGGEAALEANEAGDDLRARAADPRDAAEERKDARLSGRRGERHRTRTGRERKRRVRAEAGPRHLARHGRCGGRARASARTIRRGRRRRVRFRVRVGRRRRRRHK